MLRNRESSNFSNSKVENRNQFTEDQIGKYREQFSKIYAIMMTKFTTKYSSGICGTVLNDGKVTAKRERYIFKKILKGRKIGI